MSTSTHKNRTAEGMSRRHVLAAGALTAAAVAAQGSLGASRASAAAAPAIFYSPHQDDEAIGMAGSILEHKAAGRPVYLVLVSRGENDGLARRMNVGACELLRERCAAPNHWHDLNWPTDGASMIVPARTAEFMASAKAIGVDKVINFDLPDSAHDPSTYGKFVDAVTAKVKSLARKYPGASHKFAAGWLDVTPTHKACSDAAYRLMNDGTIRDVRFNHIYAYDRPYGERARGASYVLNIPSAHMTRKRNSIYCYNTWNPDRNFYALGYHSAYEKLEPAHGDPREFIYTLPSNYRPGKM
ncbi:PIG-L family deacetylase [Streptomyces luteolifulvus]|uniref:PIG-L family deacetylase n=1 Tax=Streptomyces luteolifulvus TaxID=2615112 RepID=A0A6H9V9S8_9ACTN|nr:PIG-L family deacetylase [Streptomyces luteolifulvus]KAB1150049.1 PIG-L family deacetylase [Streptomyces luteolifulvus]